MAALKLTDDQKTKMQAIREDSRTKMEAIRNDASLSDDDRRSQMRDLMRGQMNKIEAILTPEQQKIFEQQMASFHLPRGGAGGGNTGAPHHRAIARISSPHQVSKPESHYEGQATNAGARTPPSAKRCLSPTDASAIPYRPPKGR